MDLGRSAYRIPADRAQKIPVFVYHFGSGPAEGCLAVTAPAGWKAALPEESVKLTPGGRLELALDVDLCGPAVPDHRTCGS